MRTPSRSEEASKSHFEAFLRQYLPATLQTWHVAEDPLDYLLELDANTFIVEVTALQLLMNVGGRRLPGTVVRDLFDEFIREVESAAIEEGLLSGTYIASFPRPIEHFSSLRDSLKLELLGFLEQMMSQPSNTEAVFLRHNRRRFTLKKIDTGGTMVVMSGPYDSRREAEARDELCELVGERINEKASRARKQSLPTILLLDERFAFAEGAMYFHCQPDPQAVAIFHSIYVCRPGGTCQ